MSLSSAERLRRCHRLPSDVFCIEISHSVTCQTVILGLQAILRAVPEPAGKACVQQFM